MTTSPFHHEKRKQLSVPERAKKEGTREYSSWRNMLNRCRQPSCRDFHRYGGRGIEVRYKSFEEFVADVGPCPGAGFTVDRKNNDGHYEPGNCRWSTPKEQGNNTSRNRVITFDGASLTITQWAERLDMNANTLEYRIVRGWPLESALTRATSKRKGEDHGRAKLTGTQVVAIRSDPRRTSDVATDYGVSRKLIDAIRQRKVWRHV